MAIKKVPVITGWRWYRAGVHGTLLHTETVVTTARIATAVDHGDGTFTIHTALGRDYLLREGHGGPSGLHTRHMVSFARKFTP